MNRYTKVLQRLLACTAQHAGAGTRCGTPCARLPRCARCPARKLSSNCAADARAVLVVSSGPRQSLKVEIAEKTISVAATISTHGRAARGANGTLPVFMFATVRMGARRFPINDASCAIWLWLRCGSRFVNTRVAEAIPVPSRGYAATQWWRAWREIKVDGSAGCGRKAWAANMAAVVA